MKVLHVVPAIPYGGAQRSVAQLAGQQRREGIDARVVTLYHSDTFDSFIDQHDVPHFTTGRHSPFDIRAWIRLVGIVNEILPDIIHLNMTLFWNLFILSSPLTKKCPWVFHARQFAPKTKSFKERIIRKLLRANVDAVIGASKSATDDIKQYLGPDIPIYRTIYNGIYLPEATVFSPKGTLENHAAHGRPRIGMATRFAPGKGIKEFIEAISTISQRLPGARFVLAGEGPLRSWAQVYSSHLSVNQVLDFPGFISHTPRFWASMDFALFTSPAETFGLSIIEPQAANTVVVGYLNGSGSDEIILSGKTGVLVPWGDREGLARVIAALWSDPGRYQRMADAARQRLQEEFSIQKTAQKCLELYQELLDSKNLPV
jgi:glycosyltransferase involved in cell wall biosynthesis